MYAQFALCALALTPLAAAHGKIAVITGDQGGNGTALGIKGAVVPGAGENYQTEVDTTVFWSQDIRTDDDIGYTEDGSGNNQLEDLADAMALSGDTLPQVSDGGSVTGTYHIVTTDGAGPVQALIDSTATGKWSEAADMTVTQQPAGENGNIEAPSERKRSLWTRALVKMGLLSKRADNVNEDYVSFPLSPYPYPPYKLLYIEGFSANMETSPSPLTSPLEPTATELSTTSATCA